MRNRARMAENEGVEKESQKEVRKRFFRAEIFYVVLYVSVFVQIDLCGKV